MRGLHFKGVSEIENIIGTIPCLNMFVDTGSATINERMTRGTREHLRLVLVDAEQTHSVQHGQFCEEGDHERRGVESKVNLPKLRVETCKKEPKTTKINANTVYLNKYQQEVKHYRQERLNLQDNGNYC